MVRSVDVAYSMADVRPSGSVQVFGTPDVNDDGIPDFYATRNDGTLHLFYGGRTAVGNGWRVEEDDWNTARAIG
ncbi:predicted protein [Streptomyces sp. C]|nr:predicted protein [Streptomyces sp. C]